MFLLRRAAVLPAFFVFVLTLHAAEPDELAASGHRANSLMSQGKYQEAIPIYKKLVQALPANAGLRFNLGLAQHMAGLEREAIPNFEAVLKVQPRNVPALVSLGAARLSIGDPGQAIRPLERAIAADPKNKDTRGMLAGALLATERFEDASEQYRKLADLSPDDSRAWYGLGMSYQGIATKAFERLRQIDTTSPFVAALVADTRVKSRQFRSAFFFYSEALKSLPQMHGIHGAIAEVYRKTGHADWAAAEEAKERALPPPDCGMHPAACQFLGGHDLQAAIPAAATKPSPETLYWQAKAANELALQSFFRLGQLPPSVELYQLQAEIARNQGQHLEAVKQWRAALQLAPENMHARQELATSLFLAQDYKTAIAEAAPLLAADPRSPELNFVMGDSYLRMEEAEMAVPYLNAALNADPKMTAAHASLGLALARLGRNPDAATHLEKALELDDDGSLHYQLARVYAATGEAEKSRTTMQQYQEILKRVQQQKDDVAREAQIAPPR